METTVLIIGGGITGSGIARDLSLRGIDVTLVEKGSFASGTSGSSHGLLHSGARYANSDRDGARECIVENEIIREISGNCIEDTGGLFVKLDSDDDEYFEEKVESCREIGIPVEVHDGDTAREIEPELSESVEKVAEVPDAAIYPSRLVAATLESAEQNGASVYSNSPVEDIIVTDNEIESVQVGGELDREIEPKYVVNATGAWAEECAELAGVTVKMNPTKGVMVSVDYPDLNTVVNRSRETDDGDIAIPHQREVVLGTTSVQVEDPEGYPKEEWEVELMFEEIQDMLPDLTEKDITRTYWGVRPLYAPDEEQRVNKDGNTGDGRSISRGFQLLDHSKDGVSNFCSVVGGKLTTHRLMAEETVNFLSDKLGFTEECVTDTTPLPDVEDESKLDQLVSKYQSLSPADKDVVES